MDLKRIVYLTAGAGGMYCGSCLNDNTLARAIGKQGVDIQLVPTYTPITTDEHDFTVDRVFFGGINVYLQQKFAPLRWIPRLLDRALNNPALIRWATKKDVQTDPAFLGAMTVSMLKASDGNQKKEVQRLLSYLDAVQPNILNFTNALISGCIPELRSRIPAAKIVVTLQGDDIFLDYIPEPYRSQSIEHIRRLSEYVDAYVTHSEYYAEYMSDRLGIDRSKIHIVKLGIDHTDFYGRSTSVNKSKRIGYLARLTPEKGLHVLVDAFIALRQRREDVELAVAGWVGTEHKAFADEQFAKLSDAGLQDVFSYAGTVNRDEKIEFLQGLDVFSVPTTYREPKGRFALEAMAAGVPVVLPSHGAFPELINESQCGQLMRPNDPDHLTQILDKLLGDEELCQQLGSAGRKTIIESRNADSMALQTLELYRGLLG